MSENTAKDAARELELIRRVSSGDEESFNMIVNKYERLVYNMARFYIKNDEDALDIAQEVFIRLWRSAHLFRGDCSLSSWIYKITQNICADFSRKRKLRSSISLTGESADGDELHIDIPDHDAEPERELLRREVIHAVRAAIAQLDDDHREIIILRDMQGYTYEKIAEILAIPVNTVKSRLSRARQSLKKILSDGNKSK